MVRAVIDEGMVVMGSNNACNNVLYVLRAARVATLSVTCVWVALGTQPEQKTPPSWALNDATLSVILHCEHLKQSLCHVLPPASTLSSG